MIIKQYTYELIYRLKYLFSSVICIYIYILIYNDDINQYINSFFFLEESYFLVEYNPYLNNLYIKNQYEYNVDIFIDYHLINSINIEHTNINNYILLFIIINVIWLAIYEIYLFYKPILYYHENLLICVIFVIGYYIISIDIIIVQLLYHNFIIIENTDMYYNTEFVNVSIINTKNIQTLIYVCIINATFIWYFFIANNVKIKHLIYSSLFALICSSWVSNDIIKYLFILLVKYYVFIEFLVWYKLYMSYIFLLLQKKSIGICTGI